ncbi:MAG: winged helix-turn-helix domain-containing protein [Alphaproteobacteria bacterium]|jgi:DNA-binding response OmpR family regulator|nr:winged helix-turn-helix domain-containing protein [Alphaproteobacteria bacterium]
MKNIYIYFADTLVAEKFFSYLKNYFNNIFIFTSDCNLQKNTVITDYAMFKEQWQKLKNTHVILLATSVEVEELQGDLSNVILLNTPIKMADLITILEQKNLASTNMYIYKDYILDTNDNVLYSENLKVHLSEKEALVLKEFFSNPNIIISKEYFLKEVWNIHNMEVISQSLENYISNLRKKFHENGIDLNIIKDKSGYKIG